MKIEVEIRDNSPVHSPKGGERPRCSVWWQTYETTSDDFALAQIEAKAKAQERWPGATSYGCRPKHG
jgi:hypothetical protein